MDWNLFIWHQTRTKRIYTPGTLSAAQQTLWDNRCRPANSSSSMRRRTSSSSANQTSSPPGCWFLNGEKRDESKRLIVGHKNCVRQTYQLPLNLTIYFYREDNCSHWIVHVRQFVSVGYCGKVLGTMASYLISSKGISARQACSIERESSIMLEAHCSRITTSKRKVKIRQD